MSVGTFTSTPPIESMNLRKPSKSMIATWSTLIPRKFSIVRTVSFAPPVA